MSLTVVIEILAAVIGATMGGACTSALLINGRARENRDIVIRLTVGVENVAKRLEELHVDIKADRSEVYARLTALEQRTSKLEGRNF
jgi:outer membrane murein-binding lipoprotein Lpp